jgi:hypothetical protein
MENVHTVTMDPTQDWEEVQEICLELLRLA